MAVDIFPLQRPIAPLNVGLENLAIDAYVKGLKAPNAIGALAEGITGGIAEYRKGIEANQVLEENQLKLERQRATQGDVIAQEGIQTQQAQTNLDISRDKLAEETKDRQREEALYNDLNAGGPARGIEILTNGEYSDVFSKNKELYNQTVERLYPLMSETARAGFKRGTQDNAYRNMLLRQNLANQNKIQNNARDAQAALAEDVEIVNLAKDHFGSNTFALADAYNNDKLTFIHPEEVERDEKNQPIIDPGTGQPKRKQVKAGDIESKNLEVYRDGRLLTSNFPTESFERLGKNKAARNVLASMDKTALDTHERIALVEDSLQAGAARAGITLTGGPPASSATSTPATTSSPETKLPTAQAATPQRSGLPTVKDVAQTTDLRAPNTLVNFAIVNKLGLTKEDIPRTKKVIEKFAAKIRDNTNNQLSLRDIANGVRDYFGNIDNERRARNEAILTTADDLLRVNFEAEQEKLKEVYNEEAVRAHNKAVDLVNTAPPNSASTSTTYEKTKLKELNFFKKQEEAERLLNKNIIRTKVQTPFELYAARNKQLIMRDAAATYDEIQAETIRQVAAQANTPQTIAQLDAFLAKPVK